MHVTSPPVLPRSRLGRRMYGHRPTSIPLHTHNSLPIPFYQTARWQYVATPPTHTYIALTHTKYSYKLINSLLLLTMRTTPSHLTYIPPYLRHRTTPAARSLENSLHPHSRLLLAYSCPAFFTHCLIPRLSSLPNLLPLTIATYGPIFTYPSSRRHVRLLSTTFRHHLTSFPTLLNPPQV